MFKVFLCITQHHDLRLVPVAALVCICATLATFFLYSRVSRIDPTWARTVAGMCVGHLGIGRGRHLDSFRPLIGKVLDHVFALIAVSLTSAGRKSKRGKRRAC